MDFYRIVMFEKKDGSLQIRPDWKVGRSKDLMTRGGAFYAVWDEEKELWSTDIYDVQRLVDADLERYATEYTTKTGIPCGVSRLESNSTKLWDEFRAFLRNSGNSSHSLDEKLVFTNTQVKKEDYASRKLDYALEPGECESWNTLVGTLFNDEERAKIEWAIGAVVSGESKHIQKFLVFYGPPGSGKSTILNVVQMLFDGYVGVFDARELAGSQNAFATAAFKSNPLVAIQHDGDLSKIVDNTKLNSIVAHEIMTVNEKYKAQVPVRSNAFLLMGTNVPVKISDAKSGLIRRLIDVVPTQQTLDIDTYHELMARVEFELGAIAHHCLGVFLAMGKNFYNGYRPTEMMLQTDIFYNFVEYYFDIFSEENGITLKRAWELYKAYCSETGIDKMIPQYKLREELKNYYTTFTERTRIDGDLVRSHYSGFKNLSQPTTQFPVKPEAPYTIVLGEGSSIFDELYPGLPAQYTKKNGDPAKVWKNVTTTLGDLDTRQLHWVRVPENHIVIDFDLVDENGNKDLDRNLKSASRFPATYTEISSGGSGLHLHYLYTGDVTELAAKFDDGIEVKTLLGNSSLRRRLTKSNNHNITSLSGGLPKKEKPLITGKSITSEKGLRELIARNLRKEIQPGTKPSVDFIKKILDDAYESGMAYNVLDMRSSILTFAAKSSNQAQTCLKIVQTMKFVGNEEMPERKDDQTPLVLFDVEVFPNLLVVCWKTEGSSDDSVVAMINPTDKDIEPLFSMKLVGFNNRRYDNHILYARHMGYSIEEIYRLSEKITSRLSDKKTSGYSRDFYFGEAYNLSYADVWDLSSLKQGLKRFQIELGIRHMELDLPWDQPVPEHLWPKVVEYCCNDVVGLEAVLNARRQDFVARQMLAEISGLSVNHTTQTHAAKIIFGDEKNPQRAFNYFDLGEEFPGYSFDGKESTYHGEVTGEGGYVYSEPGIYENVALLDVASMHPATIENLNLFGPFTERFSALKETRLAIKRKDYEGARRLLDGKLGKFLGDDKDADALAYALKIVINSVYGLTSASFPNPFRDGRNRDNIVAKRGALFMIDLKRAVQELGYQVVHIKTDSIKVPLHLNGDEHIIQDIIDFGAKYGYHFEHETTYDWFCLINDADYIARTGDKWTAVGTKFQHPYVFKTLFSKEELTFDDFCEMKNVQKGAMYLDFGSEQEEDGHLMHVGRTGSFVPIEGDPPGALLIRLMDDKRHAVNGTKGHLWITREMALQRKEAGELKIDTSYFHNLQREAVDAIGQFDGVSGLDAHLVIGQ